MEILFLAHRIPFPPDKGDKIRSYRWLGALAQRYPVHLGCFIDDPEDWAGVERLQRLCASLHAVALPRWKAALRGVGGLARGEALTASIYRDHGLARWVEERSNAGRIGCIVAFSSAMAGYCTLGNGASIGRILDFVDVDAEKWRLLSLRSRWPRSSLYRREARHLLSHDRQALREFDLATFVSAAEAGRFRSLVPEAAARVRVLRNGVDAGYFAPGRAMPNPYGSGGPVLVFTGAMNYRPNEEAAIWFATEVLPRLRAEHPSLCFAVVGRLPSLRVRRLARLAGVEVLGQVADMRPYLAHAAAAVAPLPAGIGVPNKILEGMAMARPVITTPEAVHGLDLEAGRDLLVASGAEAFTAAVREALAGGARIQAVASQARQRVVSDYDWAQVERQMQALVAEIRIAGEREDPRRGALR